MVEVPRQDPEPNQVLLVYVKLQVGLLQYSNFYVHAEHYQVLSHLFFAPRINSAKNAFTPMRNIYLSSTVLPVAKYVCSTPCGYKLEASWMADP
jgi:hypothetical protein